MALSIQDQLAKKVKDLYPQAEVKKINKDNFLDIHIPLVHVKRGTHLFFNTSKNSIKIGFYCREEEFIKKVLNKTTSLESYSQGLRPKGNPEFTSVDDALEAANAMINAMIKSEKKETKKEPSKSSFKKESNQRDNTKVENKEVEGQKKLKNELIKLNERKQSPSKYCFENPKDFLTSMQLLRYYYLKLSKSSQRFRTVFEKLLMEFTSSFVVPKIADQILRTLHQDGFGIGALLLNPMYDAERTYDKEFKSHDDYVKTMDKFIDNISQIADEQLKVETIRLLIKLGNNLEESESPSKSLSSNDRYLPVALMLKANPDLEPSLHSVLNEIEFKN